MSLSRRFAPSSGGRMRSCTHLALKSQFLISRFLVQAPQRSRKPRPTTRMSTQTTKKRMPPTTVLTTIPTIVPPNLLAAVVVTLVDLVFTMPVVAVIVHRPQFPPHD
ncbi:hypothetical protein HBH70_030180 [Parastagonospora nodorum]|nr:hypothetical protein HBH42_116630 [Parastagonospora nodorum]KAH5105979.1 hypothetical protein HBH72_058540 [Parastagonospora nodorum]KAH5148692.1 hypothetical protein HBH70_030180 [Parastagonospora nodorum]KAH5315891.1 hypothetical protein HBI50_134460 [Parastagonospora nodorum]KAH5772917.1 hypothetical protein HBI16_113310 [Parastagonospora nodorum]